MRKKRSERKGVKHTIKHLSVNTVGRSILPKQKMIGAALEFFPARYSKNSYKFHVGKKKTKKTSWPITQNNLCLPPNR